TGFINESVQKQPGQQQLTESKKAYQQQLLSELFDFTGILQRLSYCQKIVNEHPGSIIGDTSVMLEKSLSALKTDVIEVSGKFQLQLKELLNSESDPEENMPLQERVRKAAAFFYEKLKVSFKEILPAYKVETDNRTIRRSVNEAFERTAKECLVKLECLDSAKTGFQISRYLNARAKSLTEIPATKAHSRKEAKDASVVTMHPDLYMALKDWRSNKAREQDVPHYRVMHQKTLLAISNKLPRTMATLGIVRGIGAKTIREYGEEVLELITAYCEMENIEAPENHDIGPDPEKKKKVDTRKITMDLFRQGNTPAQIAEIRKLSLSTIEGHLACFVGTGEIAVTEFVPKEIVDLITNHFVSNGDLKIGPVKEALGEKVSWGDIRFVASHLKHIQ
ncbi:MAG TPA: helix-turn-helix domain-containing protein, partial [Bacteroidales bacterium]|nr:helix-turn-helix domain-containing protein [Bacteroidales bacterium]